MNNDLTLIVALGPVVNTWPVRALQPVYDQTDNKSSGKRAASGLVLTDLTLWSLTVLKLLLVWGKSSIWRGEAGPGVRIVPSPCSHNAWLMTECRAPVTVGVVKNKK